VHSPSGRSTPSTPLNDPKLLINRELSWLDFNERVLLQATGTDHPPLERVKFLAIVATNLEEFFMVRVASLLRKSRSGLDDVSPDGLSTSAVLGLVRKRAMDMLRRQASCWDDVLKPLLREHGIHLLDPREYPAGAHDYLQQYFSREISPALTPLAFDPGHPFPYISNLSLNLAVVVRHGGGTKFARVKLPDVLPRFMASAAER
jgi:polyphosphate kinase